MKKKDFFQSFFFFRLTSNSYYINTFHKNRSASIEPERSLGCKVGIGETAVWKMLEALQRCDMRSLTGSVVLNSDAIFRDLLKLSKKKTNYR